MPSEQRTDFLEILRVLTEHRVDFIVVGGVCGALHGSPVLTYDLDIVHSRAPENVERLLAALQALDAHYRFGGMRKLAPGPTHLASEGHQLLMTQFGPLDVLGVVGKSREYRDLLPHTEEANVGEGLTVRLLDLDTLIETKQEIGGEKDAAALAVLRQLRKARQNR